MPTLQLLAAERHKAETSRDLADGFLAAAMLNPMDTGQLKEYGAQMKWMEPENCELATR